MCTVSSETRTAFIALAGTGEPFTALEVRDKLRIDHPDGKFYYGTVAEQVWELVRTGVVANLVSINVRLAAKDESTMRDENPAIVPCFIKIGPATNIEADQHGQFIGTVRKYRALGRGFIAALGQVANYMGAKGGSVPVVDQFGG
mgnify:FL=1